jgi:hypothetical protein
MKAVKIKTHHTEYRKRDAAQITAKRHNLRAVQITAKYHIRRDRLFYG